MTARETRAASATDIAGILAELRRSQDATARETRLGAAAGSVATLNFVVYIDEAHHRPWVMERAAMIAEKHPSRLVVLDASDASGEATVATDSRENAGTTIASERVRLAVGDMDPELIRGLAHDLTVPDVPNVLWWTSSTLLGNRVFPRLSELAGSVVVDSSGSVAGTETIGELGSFASRFPHVSLRDLAFMRLAPWQDMIAQFFDDPALREDLFEIDRLEIDAGSEAEALYLAGWLGSRLSWEPRDAATFRTKRGDVRYHYVAKGEQRRMLRVMLATPGSEYTAEVSADDEFVICCGVTGARAKTPWCVPLQNVDNASLIERAIFTRSTDEIFESSLNTVREMLR